MPLSEHSAKQTDLLTDHATLVRTIKGPAVRATLARFSRFMRDPANLLMCRLGYHRQPNWRTQFVRHRAWPDDVRRRIGVLPSGFFTDYSLRPDTALFIYRWILRNRPASVLEYGCGISTVIIALALLKISPRGSISFVSLETDALWCGRTADALSEMGLSSVVTLKLAPLIEVPYNGHRCQGPAVEGLQDLEAEMLFIDAPPAQIGRLGVLPALIHALACPSQIFMDDACRDAELRCIKAWTDSGLIRLDGFAPVGNGLAVATYESRRWRP